MSSHSIEFESSAYHSSQVLSRWYNDLIQLFYSYILLYSAIGITFKFEIAARLKEFEECAEFVSYVRVSGVVKKCKEFPAKRLLI